jgi:MFS family permease
VQWIWVVLGVFVGYWTSEWPRKVFAVRTPPLEAGRLADRQDRLSAHLFTPMVFVAGAVLTFAAFVLARTWAPKLTDEYFGFWVLLVIQTCVGMAVGFFELATGLTPTSNPFDAQSRHRLFYDDPIRARKVGSWRLASCVFMNVLAFLAARFAPV